MVRKLIFAICFLTVACASPQTDTPISPDKQTDQAFDAAVQQAHGSLDKFIELIAMPHPDRTIVAVKVRFFPPDSLPQDIWVDGVSYTDGVFRGDMGDDIPSLKLKFGKKITIEERDILDWMIVQDGKLIGGYTIRLAVKRMSPEDRQRFLNTLDYSIED